MTSCIVVEKIGSLKSVSVKDYAEDNLYKKCGFKKGDGFEKQTEWKLRLEGQSYKVCVFGKTSGRANSENKYDFPPPIDTTLMFGSCLIVGFHATETQPCDLPVELWEKMYEKLFGGFEDLASTIQEDENEEDELQNIPDKYKTSSGYLKDGFIVSDTEEGLEDSSNEGTLEMSLSMSTTTSSNDLVGEDANEDEDVDSELSEESYDYSSGSDNENDE